MQELLLILILLLCIKIRTQKKKEILMTRLCCLLLLGFHRDLSKPYLTQDVLLGLDESPWMKIYNKRDDNALLQILNINIKQFQTLHDVFRKHWKKYIKKPRQGGTRRRKFNSSQDNLALALSYLSNLSHSTGYVYFLVKIQL
eukprot:g61260.t1